MSKKFDDLTSQEIEEYNALMSKVKQNIKAVRARKKEGKETSSVKPYGYVKPPRLRTEDEKKELLIPII